MNELYGLQDISDDEFQDRMCHTLSASGGQSSDVIPFRNSVRASMMVPPELIMAAVKDIYNDTIKEGDLSPELFEGISNVIQSACQKGVDQSSFDPDDEFRRQLAHSADVFSAFKVHSAQQAIASKLLDDQGNLRSFRDFQDAVAPITSHQCGRWLRTEYDTAVIRAHQAADWQQFLEEADVFPNLEWMPSTSVTPGADHVPFWHTILPINDPFWTQHRPGDRWNCKCSLQATDKAPTGRPTSASPVNTDPQPGLDSNPGATSEVFSQSHPYFPSDCNSCPFRSATVPSASADGNFKNQAKDCMHCQAINACIDRTEKPRKILIAQEGDIRKIEGKDWYVDYESANGDLLISSERVEQANKNKTERDKFLKERSMCRVVAKNGHNVEYRKDTQDTGNTFDIYIDGIPTDLKKVDGGASNIVGYISYAFKHQGAKAVVVSIPNKNSEYYEAFGEAHRKLSNLGRIFFYVEGDFVLKEIK